MDIYPRSAPAHRTPDLPALSGGQIRGSPHFPNTQIWLLVRFRFHSLGSRSPGEKANRAVPEKERGPAACGPGALSVARGWRGTASFLSLSPFRGREKTEQGRNINVREKLRKEGKNRRGSSGAFSSTPWAIRFFRRLSCPDTLRVLRVPRLAALFHLLLPALGAALGLWASAARGCWGDITPKLCPSRGPPASAAVAAAAPVYCVCELFTCFVCCHPASETRQTSKLTQENKVRRYPRLPPLSGTLLQPSPPPSLSLSLSQGTKQKSS